MKPVRINFGAIAAGQRGRGTDIRAPRVVVVAHQEDAIGARVGCRERHRGARQAGRGRGRDPSVRDGRPERLTQATDEVTIGRHQVVTELFDIETPADLKPRQNVTVTATKADASKVTFTTMARVDTPVEVDYYRNGGILQLVLRRLAKG